MKRENVESHFDNNVFLQQSAVGFLFIAGGIFIESTALDSVPSGIFLLSGLFIDLYFMY